jgi:hypothetical protein
MREWNPAELELVTLLPRTGRGPRREGVYALWLLLRVAQDLLLDPPLADRAARRRLASLEARFSSLTLPPPLRRALTAALLHLREGGPQAVPVVLATLVAPARETTGDEAGEAIQRAARAARQSATVPSR